MIKLLPAAVCAAIVLASSSAAKSLRIDNDTDQVISGLSVESEGKGKGPKKPKKDLALGLAVSPNHGKGKSARAEDSDARSHTQVDVEVAEDDCLGTLTFTLSNGRNIRTPKLDLCTLDGVIVEEPVEDPSPN